MTKYRRIIALLGGPIVGMDSAEAFEVPLNTTDDYITDIAYTMCVEHYNSYGYEQGSEQVAEELGDDIELEYDFHWEDYDPEKHDPQRAGGGSFAEEFED